MNKKLKTFAAAVVLLAVLAAGLVYWAPWKTQGPGEGFVSGNGRIEATEVAVATKQAGRVLDILVGEGDFVTAGQPVARMQIDSLQAQRDEAMARLQQAQLAVSSAQVQVAQRESDYQSALAVPATVAASARPLSSPLQPAEIRPPTCLGGAPLALVRKSAGSWVMKLTSPAMPSEPYSADAGPRTTSMRLSSSMDRYSRSNVVVRKA